MEETVMLFKEGRDAKKRRQTALQLMAQLGELPARSRTAHRRHHLFLRLLMLAHAYPIDMPRELLEDCAQQLADSQDGEDLDFVIEHFPHLKAAQRAENAVAAQWSEEPAPKSSPKKQ